MHFLGEVKMEESEREAVVETCGYADASYKNGDIVFEELRRYYYVPTSYLELIKTFKKLIGRKKRSSAK